MTFSANISQTGILQDSKCKAYSKTIHSAELASVIH